MPTRRPPRTPPALQQRTTTILAGSTGINFLSRWFFCWLFPVLVGDTLLPNTDALALQLSESAEFVGHKLERKWDEERRSRKRTASIYRALLATFVRPYALIGIWSLLWIAFTYLSSYFFVKRFLGYVESWGSPNSASALQGHMYAIGLLLTTGFASVCSSRVASECGRVGVQVRAALMVLIYRKSLRLGALRGGIGDIVNLISNDCNRIAEACVNFHFLWSSVVEMIVVIILLGFDIGLAMLPALALLLILIPLQSYIAHRISSLTELTSYLTASRIHLMSETLTALKLIKLHAWERFFLSNARKVREKEVRRVRSILLLKALGHSIAWSVGVVSAVTCFAVLVFVTRRGVPMTASTVFTVLALLNALRHPLTTLPIAIRTTLGAKSSLERLDAFLRQPDIEELSDSTQSGGINLGPLLLPPSQPSQQPGQPGPLRVVLMGVTIGYDGASTPALQNLSMALQQGQLLAIVGAVGAGKSSILAAIMGQLHLDHGTRHVHGRIAYVPHDPFIVNASLRDNILFGKPYDTARYSEILRVCNLKRDLLQLSHGDATELGERGVNLSMGQRQRVALARACYCDAEIVLLDDPLSVMDAHVGKHIFTECIKGYLRNKAIIFVTNQLHFLEHCDHILVMENGICTEQGSYSTLLANDVNLASLIGDSIEIEDPSLIDEMMNEVRLEPGPSGVHRNSTSAPNSARPSATLEEVRSEGSIHLTVPGNPAKRPASASRRPSSTGVVTMPITFREPDPPSRPSFHQPSPSESMVQHDVATINRIIEQNSHTIQSMNITPQTIAQYVERTQLTILSGAGIPGTGGGGETTRVVNNTDVNAMQKAIEKNQLTIHSLADVEVGPGAAILDPETGLVVVRKQRRRKKATEFVLWWGYIKRKTGAMLGILMLVGFFLVWGVRVFSDYWLRYIVGPINDMNYVIGVYGGLAVVVSVGVMAQCVLLMWNTTKKSVSYHDRVFKKIYRAPIAFFDITPLGRILNLFARHQFVVDEYLADSLLQALQYTPVVVGSLVLITVVVPFMIVLIVLLGGIVWFLITLSNRAEEKLKQLDANTKGPIFSHLSATLEGLFSIRVFNVNARFDQENIDKIDANHKALFATMQIRAWRSLYLDLTASLLIYFTALFLILFRDYNSSWYIDPSTAGIAITNALVVVIFGQWTIRAWMDVRAAMVSVQQLTYYGDHITAEGGQLIKGIVPPEEWPKAGEIEFRNVVLRYQRYGVAVLKNISLIIKRREKIGIVGKTGSGKSTFLISLFRLVETSEGQIMIDGLDISSVQLKEVRSRIAIISQEPVIFQATMRENLDPFNKCTDEEIWSALHAVHLADKIKSMPQKLDTNAVDNGRNFSLGQRQLFCIARAILMKCRVLVLDEATCEIDLQTEILIRDVIRNNFADCTVLTIAHRLRTIMDSDKLLVLSDGRVIEFDSPKRLVHDTEGYFYNLVRQNGDGTIRKLQEMAGPWPEDDQPDNGGDGANSEVPPQSPTTSTPPSSTPPRHKTPDHLQEITETEPQGGERHTVPSHAPHHMPRSLEEVFHRPANEDDGGPGRSGSMSST